MSIREARAEPENEVQVRQHTSLRPKLEKKRKGRKEISTPERKGRKSERSDQNGECAS
jgi:hypothetical protein